MKKKKAGRSLSRKGNELRISRHTHTHTHTGEFNERGCKDGKHYYTLFLPLKSKVLLQYHSKELLQREQFNSLKNNRPTALKKTYKNVIISSI